MHARPAPTARRSRPLLATLILGLTVVGFSGPAGAQTPPAPTTTIATTPPVNSNPSQNTWSISPTGADPTQPSDRLNFSYQLAPGTSVDDSATVWNYSDGPRTFDVYARDAFNKPDGGIDLLTKDKVSTDLGGWVALSVQRVDVPAHSGVTVPFSVTAPRTASPGDHDAGIVVSLVTASGDGSRKVVVDSRVGVRVYLRVTGPLTPSLVVDQIESSYTGTANPIGRGGVDVTYTVHNTGNVRLRGHQTIEVKGPFGLSLASRSLDDLPELLPGSSATHTQHFDDIAPTIRLTSAVTVTPFAPPASGADAGGAQAASGSSSVWAIPWTLLLIVVGLVVAWRVRRRLRRRRPTKAGSGSGGSGRTSSATKAPKAPAGGAAIVAAEEEHADADSDADGDADSDSGGRRTKTRAPVSAGPADDFT